MSHVDSGPLATYNSLQDKHLVGYFNNTRMRRHLRRSGLITRNGEIVTENTFRLNMARREHQKHVRDLMAQAIVHKALDMERHRQSEIKKKLEEIAKVELVQRVRSSRGRKGDEDITPYLSPRAPSGRPKSAKQDRPRSVVSSHRPATAPSKQSGAVKKKSAIYVDKEGFPVHRDQAWAAADASDEVDSHNLRELDPYSLNSITLNLSAEEKRSNSPYKVDLTLPPDPKPPPRAPQGYRKSPRGQSRTIITKDGRRLRPKSNKGSLSLHRKEPAYPHPMQQQTLCDVTVRYRGNNLKLQYERQDKRDEIIINQQHCGGENLVVFHGLVEPGTDLVFTSRRHRGFPFSLTFFINQIQVLRLSACCEYKYGPGVLLGGRKGHFKFGRVDGAAPCYRCMVEAELARRERQRYKDTQTEEPKPEPEPKPVLESQGTQSDPPPPETRDQAEQAEAGEAEAQAYDDEDFEDEDEKEDAGSEEGDTPKAEDKSSDHFFSGPESDTEQKQPDEVDYGADSDFEVDSDQEKDGKKDEIKEEEKEEEEEEIPEEGEAKDENVPDEIPEEEAVVDETQGAVDDVQEEVKGEDASEEKDGTASVPEVPHPEDEKEGEHEHQSPRHDDSDSDSDSEGDNKVLSSSSSSSSSEDEDDQKETGNFKETVPSGSDSSSDEEADCEKKKKDQDTQEKSDIEEPSTEVKIPSEAEENDDTKEEMVEREHDDEKDFQEDDEDHGRDSNEKKEEERSPSPQAPDIPEATYNGQQQQEEIQEEKENLSDKEDAKKIVEADQSDDHKEDEKNLKEEEEEEEEKSFFGNLVDKVKDAFTSSDSSSSDSDSNDDKQERKKRRKKKSKRPSRAESDEEKKSSKHESDSDKKEKSFFEKLKDKFTSSDSDSDSGDEKKKKKEEEKEKSDSENKDAVDEGTSSRDQEQDDGEGTEKESGDISGDGHQEERASAQDSGEEDRKVPTDEEQEDKQSQDEEKDKGAGTPTNEDKDEEEEEVKKSFLDKVKGVFGVSDSESDKDEAEQRDEVKIAEDAEQGEGKEEEENEKPVSDNTEAVSGASDSEGGNEKSEQGEEIITAEQEAETGAAPRPTRHDEADEPRSSGLEDDGSQAQSEKEVSDDRGDERNDSVSLGKDSAQEDRGDVGSQSMDDATKTEDDDEEENKENAEEDKDEFKEDETKEAELDRAGEPKIDNSDPETGGAAQNNEQTKEAEQKDEDEGNREEQDADSMKEERKDDGSISSRSSVSDSGSIAGGLDKDYRVLNLNVKNLDERKAAKLAKVLKHQKYRNLEYLLLRGNPLTDAGVAAIVRALIEKHTAATSAEGTLKLTHFDLGNSGVGDEAAAELSKLLALDTQLRNLNISENSLSAAAWEAITEGFKANKSMVTFSAEYAHLSDTSCVMLADALTDHEKLEELNVEGNGLGERAGNAIVQLVKDNSVITTINMERDNFIPPKVLAVAKEILETGSYVP